MSDGKLAIVSRATPAYQLTPHEDLCGRGAACEGRSLNLLAVCSVLSYNQ